MKSNIHLIGNAHVDPAWLWRLDEGFEAFLATCRSALDRMQETSEFVFTCSSAACYEFVEQADPALFKQIQDAVKHGRWEIVGGWWVEPDCNIPTGESFVRQALYGQQFFKSRFGKTCTVGYCIDSFGHNANLPQLLRHAGMDAYIFMRPDEQELDLPQSLFRWQSASGDEILAYRIPFHYSNFKHSVGEKLSLLEGSQAYSDAMPWMLFYGVGNHGGGPTKVQIREIQERGLRMSRADRFFEEAKKMGDSLPAFRGPLHPHAIGCYSNHSALKAANRRAEHALMRAEKLCVLSEILTKVPTLWEEFDRAWKNVLINQFHDTLGGVSIATASDDALTSYGESLAIALRNERLALQRLRSAIDTSDALESLIVFNPHFHSYKGPIEFELWTPEASEQGLKIEGVTLRTPDGTAVSTQQIESAAKIGDDRVRFIANCELPAFGWRRYKIERTAPTSYGSRVTVNDKGIKNAAISFMLSREGPLVGQSIYYMPLQVYRDDSDTWAHGRQMFQEKVGEFMLRNVEIVDEGPIRGSIRVVSEFHQSRCEQLISIHSESDEVIVTTMLDWREPHAVCKMTFPHEMADCRFHGDIPYGITEYGADGKEYPVVSWGFVSDGMRGVGIISDTKSSFSCTGESISVIIARSPLIAHHVPPHVRKQHETLRYLDHGVQEFTTKIVLGNLTHEAAGMTKRSMIFHEAPVASVESSHAGKLSGDYSGAELSGSEAVVATVKKAADGEGYIIRLVETTGSRVLAVIRAEVLDLGAELPISPYEIKSYITQAGELHSTDFLENR